MENSDVEMKDATEQSQDTNNSVSHPENGSVDVQPPDNDDILNQSDTVQDTKPAELEKLENLDGAPEPEVMVDAEKNTESEVENPKIKETINLLEMPSENVDQHLQLGEKIGVAQKIKENSELEKTATEEGAVSAELDVKKSLQNEARVSEKKDEPSDEVVNEKKDEPSDEGVLTSEKDGSLNELKKSEEMVAPTSSLEDGDTKNSKLPGVESECNGVAQNSVVVMVDVPKDNVKGEVHATATADIKASLGTSLHDQNPTTPLSMVKSPSTKSGGQSEELYRNMFNEAKMPRNEDGTPEEQAAFIRELECFYRKRATEFKAPRFYGQTLNCLKLWRSVIRLGGYDRVTGSKLWRQVGESFHPPKTCTTISWTFRIFYEKALLEYERHVTEGGELQLPLFAISDPSAVDNEGSPVQASGSGRARRDSVARAMQGWHNSEGGEQIMKDKNGHIVMQREKSIKSIGGLLKQKRPNELEHPVKAARIEPSKQLVTSVVDVGPPADWVRINIRETKDCYEVYALVPGLVREEVRVQSDPAGRLVITGQPDQPDNPWGITAFKKVVSLPGRINPLQTSAVVSMHGRLFVRVPFEQ